jgi:hypothetical protein
MALLSCPECHKEVSDKAFACPHCGLQRAAPGSGRMRARTLVLQAAACAASFAAGVGVAAAWPRPTGYEKVEQLRGEQDAEGTHSEAVRQRFYRLYKEHPRSAMYMYLWARCVDEPEKQLELAEEGIRADPRFSWNFNMAARALARLGRVPEAYDEATKGAALDPGNLELTEKVHALKTMLDRKLPEEGKPTDGAGRRYVGLFRSVIRNPDDADLREVQATRLQNYAGAAGDAVRGFVVCANPYADACVRVYVPRDARLSVLWPASGADVSTLREHALVQIVGTVVISRGEPILLADSVTVEPG